MELYTVCACCYKRFPNIVIGKRFCSYRCNKDYYNLINNKEVSKLSVLDNIFRKLYIQNEKSYKKEKEICS